jgi:hypothetical protein
MKNTLVVVGVLFALGACASPPESAPPQVASARTDNSSAVPGGSSSPSSATPGSPERARHRIDQTPEERDALYVPYTKCMKEQGIDVVRDRQNGTSVAEKNKKAASVCDPLLPLPAWETDINNPEAQDFARRVVSCLQAKGVKSAVVKRSDEDGMVGPAFGSIDDQDEVSRGMKLTPECQREVASGGYK